MRESDVTCFECGAGFRRIELQSVPGRAGEYRCPACDALLENFDGKYRVEYRMTVMPSLRDLADG